MQISFCIEKKFNSTSYKDADMFCFKKKFRSTPYKDANPFCFKKNNCSHANLLTFKKKIITIKQKISCFKQKDNQQFIDI